MKMVQRARLEPDGPHVHLRRAIDRSAPRATCMARTSCSCSCATRATASSWWSTSPPSSPSPIASWTWAQPRASTVGLVVLQRATWRACARAAASVTGRLLGRIPGPRGRRTSAKPTGKLSLRRRCTGAQRAGRGAWTSRRASSPSSRAWRARAKALIRGGLPQQHPDAVIIDQTLAGGGAAAAATWPAWTGMLDVIRKLFATTNKVSDSCSANSKGACRVACGIGLVLHGPRHDGGSRACARSAAASGSRPRSRAQGARQEHRRSVSVPVERRLSSSDRPLS